jgi:hypothetical protein
MTSILLENTLKRTAFLLQLSRIMIILLPVLLMLLAALALLVLHSLQPQFKYPWLIAAVGAILAFVSVFFWRLHFPQEVNLPAWKPSSVFTFIPEWVADGISWPYALSLAALAAAVIFTSLVRAENEPMQWAGTLTLCALGILASSAGNPLTLVLTWSVIDLAELLIMLRSTEGEQESHGVVLAFSVRLAGSALLLWANIVTMAGGSSMSFSAMPTSAGVYLLIAAALRLGVLPLHLPYRKENVVRRGFGTSLRLVSAAVSLVLLARIPATALKSILSPYLVILASLAALYAAWMWLRSSDEILGRPFWVLSLASLAVASSLRGNPAGSIAWGIALILSGGIIFLYSARQKQILWIALLGLWPLSTLPFSAGALGWSGGTNLSWAFTLPLLPAQALLLTGFIRHSMHRGETSLESQEKWGKLVYPLGLSLLAGTSILLGFFGWEGARKLGNWWGAGLGLLLAAAAFFLFQRFQPRISNVTLAAGWRQIFPLRWLNLLFNSIFLFAERLAGIVTASLEGEGGVLWSLLLLVLIISILSTRGQ